MSAEVLTSLPEVYYRSERVRMQIPFPSWVDTEKMGVNLLKTERLMNIGGIKHIRVVGDVNGERTVSMPVSLGIAPDGSQYAGMIGAKETTKSLSLESKAEGGRLTFRNAEWTTAVVHLNLEEIQRQIDEKKGNLRKADSWIPYLDSALRWGIRKAGTEHLLSHFTTWQKVFIFWVNINSGVLQASKIGVFDIIARLQPHAPSLEYLLINYSLNFVIWTGLESFLYGFEDKSGKGYRLSIFPGYEIDRATILQVLSRTNKLVKPITSKT